jgi:hypothetical protein
MFTLNNYNISAIYWNPVDFNIIGEQFKLKKTPVTFNNGMSFNIFPFLNNVKDFSFNNKSGIFLTNLKNNLQLIEDNNTPANSADLTTIKSIVAPFDGNFYKLYEISTGLSGLRVSNTSTFTIENELIFNFENSYVWVENYYGGVLTNLGLGDGNLGFLPIINPLNNSQKWDYVLGDGVISLFPYGSNFKQIVVKNILNNLQINNFDYRSTVPFSNNSLIFLRSYTNKKQDYSSVNNSFTVKYNPSPILNKNLLNVSVKDESYVQNYLGIFPYEFTNSDGKYDFYFHGLKNYQTTEYRYSTTDDYREYNKIYSGTNQNRGLDKIHLGYQTNTVVVEFPPNKETAFYYSSTTNAIPLSTSGLIEDGANAGNYPYVADRLFTSTVTKFDEIEELKGIIDKTDTHDNRFLCSWLYGNKSDGNKVWYDRYYNPAYYTIDQALSSTHMLYHDRLDSVLPYVYDVPSQTILTPGVFYTYYHSGNEDSVDFLTDLNYTYTTDLSYANVLSITNWTSSILNDGSPYNNYGLTFGNSGNFYGDYWSLDGSNYALFQADNLLLPEENLTTSIWLNADDWANVNGYQIFGNYYNSGFGLINDAKTVAPLMTIINNASNKIYSFNYRFGKSSEIKTPIVEGEIVQRLTDMSYWIFDSINLVALKYSVDNAIIKTISIPGISKISQVETNSKEDLYVYDNTKKSYIILDSNGVVKGSGIVDQLANRLEIDLFDNVLPTVYGNCSVIDNDNNLWQIIGPNLYKQTNNVNNIVATVGASNQMSCDAYNNIWILSNDNSYTKIDSNGIVQFRYSFSKKPLPVQDNCPVVPPPNPPLLRTLDEDLPFLATTRYEYILTNYYQQILVTEIERKVKIPPKPVIEKIRSINFINVPAPIVNNNDLTSICGSSAIQYDYMVIVDQYDNEAYVINQQGQPVIKLNFEILLADGEKINFKTGGDFTGYQNVRKYKKAKNTTFSWKFKTIDSNKNTELVNLNYDVSNLSKGWHNFTLTYDPYVGATYYIDSIPVKSITYRDNTHFNQPYKISYDYRTSLLLGATTVKNTILNNLLNLQDGYKFIGSVADLRLYSIALSQGDVEQLYYASKFAPRIKSLNWNMKVGYRNYVEEINQWFQFQLPTNKSKYYNINIHNLQIDDALKTNIELAIGSVIGKLSPAHTELNNINWK